jgi:hypothetical protein
VQFWNVCLKNTHTLGVGGLARSRGIKIKPGLKSPHKILNIIYIPSRLLFLEIPKMLEI